MERIHHECAMCRLVNTRLEATIIPQSKEKWDRWQAVCASTKQPLYQGEDASTKSSTNDAGKNVTRVALLFHNPLWHVNCVESCT